MNYILPNWPAPPSIKAYTTVRNGWGLQTPHHEEVDRNSSLETLLKLPNQPIWITQTHSTIVIEALPENKKRNADASFTTRINHICAVLTADCLPILICNLAGTHVAAIHAGWRGLANGIIEETLAALKLPSESLLVWLGPAIGPEKFEVGKDVYDAFTQKHSVSEKAFKSHKQDKWLANLYELAKIRLILQGITHIYGGEYCTYSQPNLFFSYRRDQGKTGRMASLIWIDGNS